MPHSTLAPELILGWADRHRERTGRWPSVISGSVTGTDDLNWRRVDNALRYGLRGLAGGSSLALFLAERRGARNRTNLPDLSVRQVLALARAHHARTGAWPTMDSGPVADAPGETWAAINAALRESGRGLPGGNSLGRLLARRTRARNHTNITRLTEAKILSWADAYHRRNGTWPTHRSGAIPESPGDTWAAVNSALRRKHRGLTNRTSLYRLFKAQRHIPGPRIPVRRSKEWEGRRGPALVRLNLPVDVIERYRARGLTLRQVADLCGVSMPTARRELVRAGVTIPRPSGRPARPALWAEVVRSYRSGESMPSIARARSLSPQRVRTILRRCGVERRPKGPDLFAHGWDSAARAALAIRLRELRTRNGLKQAELATRAGVTPETISALENGRTSPTRRTVRALTEVLGVKLRSLVPRCLGSAAERKSKRNRGHEPR
jgi:transcriptional regulator with XRE-family HTH domain